MPRRMLVGWMSNHTLLSRLYMDECEREREGETGGQWFTCMNHISRMEIIQRNEHKPDGYAEEILW